MLELSCLSCFCCDTVEVSGASDKGLEKLSIENKKALNLYKKTLELKELNLNEEYYLQFPTPPGTAGQKLVKRSDPVNRVH